jgi:hypothetical protein
VNSSSPAAIFYRCLVQQHDFGVAQQGAADGHALLLPSRKAAAAGPDAGLKAGVAVPGVEISAEQCPKAGSHGEIMGSNWDISQWIVFFSANFTGKPK